MAVIDSRGLVDDKSGNLTISGDLSIAGIIVNNYAYALTQPVWFVDPANVSLNAADKNDGKTALTPLLTQAELTRRWMQATNVYGDGFFPIKQDIVVTYLSSPPDPVADPIILNVARYGSYNLSFVYAPLVVRTTTLAGITTARSGSDWWRLTAASPFTSADTASNGILLHNITSGSCAFVPAVTTGVADTSEWIAYQTASITLNQNSAPAMVTPQVNDTVSTVQLARVKCLAINIKQMAAPSTDVDRWGVSFLNFRFASDPTGGLSQNDALTIQAQFTGIGFEAAGISFTQCVFEGSVNQLTCYTAFLNCYCAQTNNTSYGRAVHVAGLSNGQTMNGSNIIIDGFHLVQARIGDQDTPSPSLLQVGLATLYGARDAFTGEQGTEIRLQTLFYGVSFPTCVIGGSCIRYVFRVVNTSKVLNLNGTAWATMIQASSGFFFGTEASTGASLFAFNPISLVIGSTLYPVTIANLDTVFTGSAIDPCRGTRISVFSSH